MKRFIETSDDFIEKWKASIPQEKMEEFEHDAQELYSAGMNAVNADSY